MVTESIRRQASTLHPRNPWARNPWARNPWARNLRAWNLWPRRAAGMLLSSLLLVMLLAVAESRAARAETPQGIFIYTISREGAPIGQQRMEFVSDGAKLRVLSRIDLEVTLLGMKIFGFNQQVEEVHDGDKLMSLTSEADDDGTDRKVNLTLQGDLLKGNYNGNDRAVDPKLITSLFWRTPALGEIQLIDTLRGKVRDVSVKDLGPETLTLPVGRVETRHYQLRGEWERELWYDANGILVAGTRPGPDGTTVRLELQQRP
jgi:hypothetical protein